MRNKHSRKKRATNKTHRRRKYRGGNTGTLASSRCVFVYMIYDEGLGNQLFYLAAGLVALNKIEREMGPNKMTLCVVPAKTNKHTSNTYEHIYNFPPKIKAMSDADARPRIDAGQKVLHISDIKATAIWSNANVKYNSTSDKNAVVPDRLYQNYLAIQSVIPTVKEMLMKNEFEHESKKSAYEKIKSTTPEGSAFIHVRRGDYKERNWTLHEEFYVRGLDELNKDPNVKKICVVSNEIDWCKNIPWKTDREIEYYDSKNELEVLYKMMVCSAGAVISASTFSSWGAMLGADMNPTSTIVYPVSWLPNYADDNNPLDFPSRWKGIPNKV
jgi:hypothetical protein